MHRGLEEYFQLQDPEDRLDRETKVMYGSGEIPREQYLKLQEKLRKGQLGRGDLAILRKEARKRLEREGQPGPFHRDPAIAGSLERLYLYRARLEDAHLETEKDLSTLEGEARRAGEEATLAGQRAQAALPDEAQARTHLDLKHRLEERSRILEERLQALRAGLQRITALRSELDTYEVELKLLESEARLAGLEAAIREGLFTP
jgi:hypothetical protein